MREEPELEPVSQHQFRTGQIVRTLFLVVMGALLATGFALETKPLLDWIYGNLNHTSDHVTSYLGISVAASALLGFLLGAGLGNLILNWFGTVLDKWENMDAGDKVTIFIGILAGLLASTPFLLVLNTVIPSVYFPMVTLVLTIGLPVLCIYVLESISDILPWNRNKPRGRRRGVKLLDTNVIIDGRIYDVARTGFLEGNMYVPGFVLDELQYIADSHDPLRRQRGRRGLDVLRHMQSDFQLEVRTLDRLAPDLGDGVDSRLVRLARAIGADIVTNDFNLNRVAALQEVKVLNINDLALGLRPNVLPSEALTITIVREGNQPQQGIGYLEDGTMVVVENGKAHMGETHEVVVSQVIQTERGKMIFAEMGEDPLPPNGVPTGAPGVNQGTVDFARKRPPARRG